MHGLSALADAATRSPPLPPSRKRPRSPSLPAAPTIVWYRGHDLRVHDHLALIHAFLLRKPIVCLFVPETHLLPEHEREQLGYDQTVSSSQPLNNHQGIATRQIQQQTFFPTMPQAFESHRTTSSISEPSPILSVWNIIHSNAPNPSITTNTTSTTNDCIPRADRRLPLTSPQTPRKRSFDTVRKINEYGDNGNDDNDLDRPLMSSDGTINFGCASSSSSNIAMATTPLLPRSARNVVPTWTPSASPKFSSIASEGADGNDHGENSERRKKMLKILEGRDNERDKEGSEVEMYDAAMGNIEEGINAMQMDSGKLEITTADQNGDEMLDYDATGVPDPYLMGRVQRWHLHHSLCSLGKELAHLGIPLVFKCLTVHETTNGIIKETELKQEDVVVEYAKSIGAQCVVWNRKYYPYERGVETRVTQRLKKMGITVKSFASESLLEPELKDGVFFDRFHPYMKFWRNTLENHAPKRPIPISKVWVAGLGCFDKVAKEETDVNVLGLIRAGDMPVEGVSADPTRIGCSAAAKKLQSFVAGRGFEQFGDPNLRRDGLRDLEHIKTSKLSAHLRFGEMSPRVLYYTIKDMESRPEVSTECMQAATRAFMRNLSLREFAYHMLNRHPSATYKPIVPEFALFPWREDPYGKLFAAWRTGTTGYPVVDAAMRQLAREGWIHNRMRFMVASFFCKYLVLPWAAGAKFLVQSLVDGDQACNTLGWQWTVGCNSDSFPFSTLVNPITFAKQSTSPCTALQYVRKYVPELKNLPDEYVFTPWGAPRSVLESAKLCLFDSIQGDIRSTTGNFNMYPLRVVLGTEARCRAREGMSIVRRIISSYRPQPTLIVDQDEFGGVVERVSYGGGVDKVHTTEISEVTGHTGYSSIITTTAMTVVANKEQGMCGEQIEETEKTTRKKSKKPALRKRRPWQQVVERSSMQGIRQPATPNFSPTGATSVFDPAAIASNDDKEACEQLDNPAPAVLRTPVLDRNQHRARDQNVDQRTRSPSRNDSAVGPPFTPVFPPEMRGPVHPPPSPFSPVFPPVSYPYGGHYQASPGLEGSSYGSFQTSVMPFKWEAPVSYVPDWSEMMQDQAAHHAGPHNLAVSPTSSQHSGLPYHPPVGSPAYQPYTRCPHYPMGDGRGCATCPVHVPPPGRRGQNFPPPGFNQVHAHHQAASQAGVSHVMSPTRRRAYGTNENRISNFPGQHAGPLHASPFPGHYPAEPRRTQVQPHFVVSGAGVPVMGLAPGVGNVPPTIPPMQAPVGPEQHSGGLRPGIHSLTGKPETSEERMHIAQLMAAMNYVNPLYGNKFQEQWQTIAMHLIQKYEITEETDRETSRHYVRLCNLKNELIESDRERDVPLRAKVTTSNLKEFFKILNLPVTGEWDRRGHGGTRGPYVYGLCKKGENRMPRNH